MNGQEITSLYSLKTRFDNDSIGVWCGNKNYRLKISEILKMINEFDFKIRKCKVNSYLEVELKED